jgi:hypothetical protein
MKKNIVTLLAIVAVGLAANAQGDEVERSTKNVTRVITLDFMKDVYTEQNVLFSPASEIGFDLNYNKIERGQLLEKGFSLGWQPIETTANDSTSADGSLQATNQMFHIHGTLRKTVLKKKPFQPYVEGLFGVKGAALSSTHTDHQTEEVTVEVPFLETALEMGYGIGFRWKLLDHLAIDMRYARVSSGELKRIIDVNIDWANNLHYTTDDWKAPLGYFRMGLSLDL